MNRRQVSLDLLPSWGSTKWTWPSHPPVASLTLAEDLPAAVVLLLGPAPGPGLQPFLCAPGRDGQADAGAGPARAGLRGCLLPAPAQGAALHHLRLPCAQRGGRQGLRPAVSPSSCRLCSPSLLVLGRRPGPCCCPAAHSCLRIQGEGSLLGGHGQQGRVVKPGCPGLGVALALCPAWLVPVCSVLCRLSQGWSMWWGHLVPTPACQEQEAASAPPMAAEVYRWGWASPGAARASGCLCLTVWVVRCVSQGRARLRTAGFLRPHLQRTGTPNRAEALLRAPRLGPLQSLLKSLGWGGVGEVF